jgi:DNA-binding GntR family transcriptional regulator
MIHCRTVEKLSQAEGARVEGDRMKLGEKVASTLRAEIVAGKLPPGTPLRLIPLAKRLGVSTTPVREALAMLERQGLLSSELHRGFRVADISSREVWDLYSLHAFISELLIERATRRLSEEDIDELDRVEDQMHAADEAGDVAAAADRNHEFHRRINLAAGSPLLVRFLSETTPFVTRRLNPVVPGWEEQRVGGHRAIIDALRCHDAPEAARLMGEHIRRSGELAQTFAEHRREGSQTPVAELTSTA